MLTPQQIKQITDNLNALVERANYDVKVTYDHRLWWLAGFGENGTFVTLINVDNDDDRLDDLDVTEEELQSMAVEVLAQVTLGA